MGRFRSSIFHKLVIIFVASLTAACKQQVVMPQKDTVLVQAESRAQDDPVVSAPAVTVAGALEQRLLDQAQAAFRGAKYTSPSHNNAYDKFKSVLLINPKNSQARAGLQAILLRYSQLIRTALSDGRVRAAGNYLDTAEIFYPNNALLKDLRAELRSKKQVLAVQDGLSRSNGNKHEYEDILLSVGELNARSETITQKLSTLALRLKDTDESVLIYARSDREGRWIYKQLKQAAQGYRVRGDIRVSKSPKVRILPPL